jgi:hypothetical protein
MLSGLSGALFPHSGEPAALDIPDVEGVLAAAQTDSWDNVRYNHHINRDYIRFGFDLQRVVDPAFEFNRAPAGVAPNWFPIAFHVSRTVGDSMAGAAAGMELLNEIEFGSPRRPSEMMALLGLPESHQWVNHAVKHSLWFLGIPHEVGAVLFAALRMNYGVLLNPITFVVSMSRLFRVYNAAPGKAPLDKAWAILDHAWTMLGRGNQAVYADIGLALDRFLRWSESTGGGVQEALCAFSVPESTEAESRRMYDYAVAHTGDQRLPMSFELLAPPGTGQNLLVASFALYLAARREGSTPRKSALVKMANAFLAFREQRDLLQPVFNGEVEGIEIFQALTPALSVHFGSLVWNYSGFRSTPTLGNWGVFQDRWPAIMAAFETLYADPTRAWEFTAPYAELATDLAAGRSDAELREAG